MTGDSDGVVLYLRVSTEDQDLEGQERELRAYAATRNWTVIGTYREKTTAIGRVEREQFEQLLHDAAQPERGWRRVLVWALDRWSREYSFVKAVGSIEQLESSGILFHSFKEPGLDSTADGELRLARDLLRGILPTIAAFESRRRSERTQLAMDEIRSGRRRTRTGRPPGRPRKITPELASRIAQLRDQVPHPKWKQIAIQLKIPAGTCSKAYSTLRRETPSAINGPVGFGVRRATSPQVGHHAD
ncbi:MAG TPA: recombinase family protein [Thermoplasmata archaeon]|nr:recombinase family protein [Thermoplasmata archaeon]